MDSTKPAPPSTNLGSLGRTVTKILRFRRASGGGGVGIAFDGDDGIHKLKTPKTLHERSTEPPGDDILEGKEPSCNREAMESLLANLFASISAVKAAYAQIQVAQSPYDPEKIQSADQLVISELKRLSELKQSFIKKQLDPHAPLAAEIQEQRNLIKTYQITTKKLETDLQVKDIEFNSLQAKLLESEHQNRSIEARLHPRRSLSALEDLHLSGLNPTHFLTVLRNTVKSVRSFVKLMAHEMDSAGWDPAAAAGSIQPDVVHRKPGHRTFAFESYVCQKMFSDFHHRDFSLRSLNHRSSWDRGRFFNEFIELKSVKQKQFLDRNPESSSSLGKFCRAKYLGLVHPKMEASFFGDLDQRALVSSGRGFPDSAFFTGFAEMARRVWLLHCLFFSFGPEEDASIFQVRRGSRFSEVYMESVAEEDDDSIGIRSTVGFTVVPGFRVGRTVIQCKVYLSDGKASGQS